MLDFSSSHILILLIVALLVVGPKDLPKFLHMIGKGVGRMRRLAEQFRASFDEMARQSELDELRREIAALRGERLPEPVSKKQPDPLVEQELLPEPELPDGEQSAGQIASDVHPASDKTQS